MDNEISKLKKTVQNIRKKYNVKVDRILSLLEQKVIKEKTIAKICAMIGKTYNKLGKYKYAINYYERSVEIYEGIYKENTYHKSLFDAYDMLAELYKKAMDDEKGLFYSKKFCDLYAVKCIDDPYNGDLGVYYFNLGYLFINQESKDDALHYYLKAQEIFRHNADEYDYDLAVLCLEVGSIYFEREWYEEAIPNYEEAATILEKLYEGSFSFEVVRSYYVLTNLYGQVGNEEKKEEFANKLKKYSNEIETLMEMLSNKKEKIIN